MPKCLILIFEAYQNLFDFLTQILYDNRIEVMRMQNKIFGYARVSSREQNLDRQLDTLTAQGIAERDIIVDKESGKDTERRGYRLLRDNLLREGDTLVITSLDRLSRSKADIKQELEYFRSNRIRIKVMDLPTTMLELPEGQQWVFEMVNNILIEVLGTIAEQERLSIRKRQREGIESARKRGTKFGRPRVERPDNWDEVVGLWRAGEITAVEAIKRLGMSASTFYRMGRQMRED